MKKKSPKTLKFSKQDVADLTKEEQQQLVGGNAPTVLYCTDTCTDFTLGPANCSDGCTGPCESVYGGGACDPQSNIENATCYISIAGACHTQQHCTYANCTQACPHSYGDATCNGC